MNFQLHFLYVSENAARCDRVAAHVHRGRVQRGRVYDHVHDRGRGYENALIRSVL